MAYDVPRNVRREARTLVGRFRGGKLVPVMAVPVRGNEGGLLAQNITYELDPIAGRMITPITAEVTAVFVPVQAIDAIKNPESDYAGLTEVIREKILSGEPLFGLENEGEISKRCGVNPRSIGGEKKVNEMVRLAHNAAVNYLRQRKYVYATKLDANSTAITPALISQTILERFNAVLDPDDRINGQVSLSMPQVQLPVSGIFASKSGPGISASYPADANMEDAAGNIMSDVSDAERANLRRDTGSSPSIRGNAVSVRTVEEAGQHIAQVFAEVGGMDVGGVSLVDFYNAEKMDELTRRMRAIVDANPEYGEEMVLRWAHGLSVDAGKVPFVVHERRVTLGRNIQPATDTTGVQGEVMRSDMMAAINFSVPIPRTELGGIIITFAAIKPDETISSQPHPFLSDVWGAENFVADELALDPVPVTIRELDSDCDQGDESTLSCYVGHNALKATYVHYGLNRHVDPNTVENKTAIWQLEVPMSVTPDTILYPDDLDHYPFADQLAEVCTYTIASQAVIQTPMIIGPTPVEELAILNDEDIFEQGSEE